MKLPEISIIIPCYNGSEFILDTLQTILIQSEKEIEVIVVDDGSTDNSASVIKSLDDTRVKYVFQNNQGVSAARNNGLKLAQGNYIVFFDADDKMSEDFLKIRVNYLKDNTHLDFVCGEVVKFSSDRLLDGYYRGTTSDAINEVLLYNQEVVTCPSNYMLKKAFLDSHNLLFNVKLSSTADKYFIVNCSHDGKSQLIKNEGKLLYRVSNNSMSHRLSLALVKDNEVYYNELLLNKLIPSEIKNKSLFLGFVILSGSYWKINKKATAILFIFKAFMVSPINFFKKGILSK
ncbi:MAG: glycosyltransferase family A protein [Bacteroidia bacterium]